MRNALDDTAIDGGELPVRHFGPGTPQPKVHRIGHIHCTRQASLRGGKTGGCDSISKARRQFCRDGTSTSMSCLTRAGEIGDRLRVSPYRDPPRFALWFR